MDWLCGVAMIYAFLFGVGKIIFGATAAGLGFVAAGLAFGCVIYRDLNRRGWKSVTE